MVPATWKRLRSTLLWSIIDTQYVTIPELEKLQTIGGNNNAVGGRSGAHIATGAGMLARWAGSAYARIRSSRKLPSGASGAGARCGA